ncbi:MAG: PKD domain-containing protein [Thermoplasmata archaeon]
MFRLPAGSRLECLPLVALAVVAMAVGGLSLASTGVDPRVPSPSDDVAAENLVASVGSRASTSPIASPTASSGGGPLTGSHNAVSSGPSAVLDRTERSSTLVESGDRMTSEAITSLERGQGPANGRPLSCTSSASGSGICGGEGTPAPPSVPAEYGFQQGTWAGSPPTFYGASLSWDADDGYIVFFGGLNTTNHQPQNSTWIYGDGVWANATATVGAAPPARYLASMSFDEYDDEMVLTGGCGVTQCPIPDTWVFYGLEWFNDTMTGTCPCLTAGGGVYAASMTAWAGTDNGTFLFGGCLDRACDEQSNASFSFQQSVGCPYYAESYPCWVELSSPHSPAARSGAALSVFQDNGTVLLYGGYRFVHYAASTYTFATLNDTWTFHGATTSWTNLTFPEQLYESGEYPNAPRTDAALFWDPYLGVIFLYGGSSTVPSTAGTAPSPTNPRADLWEYDSPLDDWVSESGYAAPAVPRNVPAFADSVESLPPVLVGGETAGDASLNDSWVWEGPLQGALTPTPTVAETNTTVVFSSTFLQAVLPSESSGFYYGTIFFDDGTSGAVPTASHEYTVPGAYTVTMRALDFFGVPNVTTTSVTVQLFADNAKVTPAASDVGGQMSFIAEAAGGAGGYTYNWSFSGGGTAGGASVTHAFATAGAGYGTVSVEDTTGTVVNESVAVTINPLPTALATASRLTADVGIPVTFNSAVVGGTAPYSYEWKFGDGSSSSNADPDHSFGAPGTYIVHLLVNDSSIGTAMSTLSVDVDPALVASASAATSSSAPGQSVAFSSSTVGGAAPYTYSWNFGDGGTATTSAPVHAFHLAGAYTVNVWINDSAGGEYHTSLAITVAAVAPALVPGMIGGLPVWVWVAVAALGAVAVVAGLGVRSRRMKHDPPAVPPPPPPSFPPPPPPSPWEEGPPPPPAR